MGIQYTIEALSQDIDDDDPFSGLAHMVEIQAALKKQGGSEPALETAVAELRDYFARNVDGYTEQERALAHSQNVEGELLSDEEGEIMEKAHERVAKTASMTKAEAKKRATLIKRTRGWPD